MRGRPRQWVLTTLLGVSLVIAAVFAVLWVLNSDLWTVANSSRVEAAFGTRFAPLLLTIDGVVFAVVGWLVSTHRPGHAVGTVCLGIGLAIVVSTVAIEYGAYAVLSNPGGLPGGEVAAWLGNWAWVLGMGLMATVLVLIFPGGELTSRGDRVTMLVGSAGIATSIVFFALAPGPLTSLPWADNPFGITGADWLEWLSVGFAAVVASMVAAGWSMRRRYRRSTGITRAQIKWFAGSAALLVTTYAGQFVYSVLSGTLDGGSAAQRWFQTLTIATFGVLGVSIGIAVLRYRLYDIDRIISRTVSYALLAGLLGLVYFGLIALLTTFLPSDDPLVVAAATLAVAALFNPLRNRVQQIVDRRFNRSRYDAEKVINEFTASLRDRVDRDSLVEDWVEVVAETMQPSLVGVWVK